ncbi:MAG TPA: LysM domain-containing protein, partial [Bacteroidia bacterium]|nr:LysM domain-containing protein [Bacteroidia bacterium]
MNKILLYLFVFLLPLVTIAADDERAFDERIHVVQPKETLYRLSRQYGVSMASIKQANKLTSDIISAAARLTIMLPKENDYFQVHIVRVSENLEGISEKYMLPFDILT